LCDPLATDTYKLAILIIDIIIYIILKRFQVGFTYFLKMINVKRIRGKSKKVKQNLQIKNLFL